ncbi:MULTISPECIES: carbohydrate ABC transporter permease [Haloferax]|uniref:ABC transporter permease subunit n=2 Tax=Haloferax TaxID=2251 RepID=A0A6G1YZA9_9EURY|nr:MULTISPECIES: carbohydrate ABC transporter permease [Haloferax]KAB1186976.1 carbohydrate ABC transporter permease [Haloferax sp. CBA1149]MRW79606.1 ABC transporter permease subunit [Haloferax marinisediminis]
MSADNSGVFTRGVQNAIEYPALTYQLLFYTLVGFVSLVFLFPLYWLLVLSVTPDAAVANLGLLPNTVTLSNYAVVLFGTSFLRHLFNGVVIATGTTLFILFVGSLAGYVFGRLEFPGRRLLMLFTLGVAYVPPVAFFVPVYRLLTGNLSVSLGPITVSSPNLYNTPFSVGLPLSALTLPLAIFILTAFYRQIPDTLEDAARVEGATRFGALFRVVLPLSKPGVATAGVFTFIQVYNEFFYSFLMTDGDPSSWAPVIWSLYELRLSMAVFGAAGSVLGLLPVVVLLLLANERLIESAEAGVATRLD